MALSVAQYVDRVYLRISRGAPQDDSKILRSAIENSLPQALQRLADRVASDPRMRVRLQQVFPLTLGGSGTAGEEPLPSALVTSEEAREGWYVRLATVANELQYLPNRRDLDNPLPATDYYFYSIFNNAIVVRDSTGSIPAETALSLYGSYVPTIGQVPSELEDNLIDVGVEIVTEPNPQTAQVGMSPSGIPQ